MEKPRQALLAILRLSNGIPEARGSPILRVRAVNLLMGLGLPELFCQHPDYDNQALRWKQTIHQLQSEMWRQTTMISIDWSLSAWTRERGRQAQRSGQIRERWDLAGFFSIVMALYEFRNNCAARDEFIDTLIRPHYRDNPSYNMFAVGLSSFPNFVLSFLTARHVARCHYTDWRVDPEQIWKLVELTMLMAESRRQAVLDALSSWVDGVEGDDEDMIWLADDTLDDMAEEIAFWSM
jgi:hypothetical protein